jgi:hypothetical protein
LAVHDGDTTEEARVDGFSGSGEVRAPRKRTKHTEPLSLSIVEFAGLYASLAALWDMSAQYEQQLIKNRGAGRQWECSVADVMVYQLLINQLRSARAVDRFLQDPRNWKYICQQVEKAFPNHPERRLSNESPTRFQYIRMLKALVARIPGFHEQLRSGVTDAVVNAAKHAGCGQDKASLTHPSKMNMMMGDATWEQSLFNGINGRPYTHQYTGEICIARGDPDAKPFHREGSAPGNYFVSVIARTEHPHERFILDSQYKPDGVSDGTVFTNMALGLLNRFDRMQGVVYDMALKSEDQDRIGATGRHVLCKVTRTKSGRVRSEVIGNHKFVGSGSHFYQDVHSVDGCPVIEVVDIDGKKHLVPLTRKQSKLNGTRMYNHFEVPDHPLVPLSKRGATAWIRVFSSQDDLDAGKPRPRFIRSIPLNDPDFDRLYGLREDTESMHNDYKSRLVNRRARTIGLERRELDLRGYQLHQMAVAIAAWSMRTGGDVSEFLGNWKPPERLQRQKAA